MGFHSAAWALRGLLCWKQVGCTVACNPAQSFHLPDPVLATQRRTRHFSTDLDVLHYDVDIGRRLDDLVEADDVGMHEQPEDLDFPPH